MYVVQTESQRKFLILSPQEELQLFHSSLILLISIAGSYVKGFYSYYFLEEKLISVYRRLRHDLNTFKAEGVTVVCIGIGSPQAAAKFCQLLDFPEDKVIFSAL